MTRKSTAEVTTTFVVHPNVARLIREYNLNQDDIQTLKAARELIENNRCWYVCTAIHAISGRSVLLGYITKLLIEFSLVTDWLSSIPAIRRELELMTDVQQSIELRAYRVRWIDHMIAEIEEVLRQDSI